MEDAEPIEQHVDGGYVLWPGLGRIDPRRVVVDGEQQHALWMHGAKVARAELAAGELHVAGGRADDRQGHHIGTLVGEGGWRGRDSETEIVLQRTNGLPNMMVGALGEQYDGR